MPCDAQSPTADGFNPGADYPVYSLAIQTDGKIVAGGAFSYLGGQYRNACGRLNADGSLDTSFTPGAGNSVFALAVQPDGKIVTGGAFTTIGGQTRYYIARLNAAGGTADTTFNPGANNSVDCLALQLDGKIVVGGWFTTLGGQTRNYLGRLNAAGTLDTTFNPGANNGIYSLALQADGKILVGGTFTTLAGQSRTYLGRLNANGTLDTAFNPAAGGQIYCIAVQADGKILVGGDFTALGGQTRYYVGRLNADGTVDSGFNPGTGGTDPRVFSLAVQADGKILVGGGFTSLGGQARNFIGRLNPNGTVDSGFNAGANNFVISIAVQGDGKVLAGGSFSTLAGQSRPQIGRLNSTAPATQSLGFDGATVTWLRGGSGPEVWATTFDLSTNGVVWTSLGAGARITGGWQLPVAPPLPSGTLRARGFVAGGYDNGSSWLVETTTCIGAPAVVAQPANRTNNPGTTASFHVTACGTLPLGYQWRKGDVALVDGGNISGVVTDTLTISNVVMGDQGAYSVLISNAVGWATSQVAMLTVSEAPGITVQPASQTKYRGENATFSVTAGGSAPLSYQWRTNAVKLSDGGNLWGSQAPTLTLTNVQAWNAGNYSVVISNQYGSVTSAVAVLTVNPVPLDVGFNPIANQTVYSLAPQADGKILVGGQFGMLGGQLLNAFGRLNADGTVDAAFVPGSGNTVFSLAVQPDGKVLAGGAFTQIGGQTRNYLARLNAANGSADGSFNPGANGHVYCLALQADGKILVGGAFTTLAGQARNHLGRLNSDGTLDTTFNPGANTGLYSLVVQPDGKILVGGTFSTLAGQARPYLGRLNTDGTLDTTFSPAAGGEVYCLAVQADGKILVGGNFTALGGQIRYYVGRLNADGTLDTGFNPGAGGADPRVFSLAVQTDGKILVGGGFTTLGGQPRNYAGRLNANGTIDTAFVDPGANSYVISLAVQADGGILLGGAFSTLAGQARSCMGRINSTEPVTQDLSVTPVHPHDATITWSRGGPGPEVWRTTFEYSIDNGANWLSLGAGARITNGWQLTGASVPANALVRVRGFAAGGYDTASSWVVEAFWGAPAFLTQPSSRTNIFGTTAAFTATASGSAPLSYQWRKGDTALADGGNVAGAATGTLTLSNVAKSDEGGYSVVASNAQGSVTSLVAFLTVADPGILSHPVSQNRAPGQSVTFSVAAVGTPPLGYQWRGNGANLSDGDRISGAATPAVTLTDLQAADAGNYDVVVSGPQGSVTSSVALLTVNLSMLDAVFNPGANDSVCALAVQPDGKIWVGGYFTNVAGQTHNWFARLNTNGVPDGTLNLGGGSQGLAGETSDSRGRVTPGIVGSDGSLPGIGGQSGNLNGGGASSSSACFVSSLAAQTDGKMLVGGWLYPPGMPSRVGLFRLTASGALDGSFAPVSTDGAYPFVNCLAIQADGWIVVGGSFISLGGLPRNGLGRLANNYVVDSGFNPAPDGFVYSLALQPDGKILVGGNFTTLAGQPRSGLGRLNADGTLDNSFNPGVAGSFPYVLCLAVQADGKILVGGTFTALAGQMRVGLGRLNADGTLDNTFNPGAAGMYPYVMGLALQADGKILVGGNFSALGGAARSGLGRLNADGTVDAAFSPGAYSPFVFGLAVQTDGSILVGGGFGTLGGDQRQCLGRLNNTEPATQNLTFDGSEIRWMRGGASPEAWRTLFDYSTNGTTWLSLGAGVRVVGGWHLSGVSVPMGSTIRARGFVTGGECNGSSWFVESTRQVVPQTPPAILVNDGSLGFQSGQFGFNISGIAGQIVVVEGSTNLVDWFALGTNTLGTGPLYFGHPGSTNLPACFYRARLQ